MSVMHSEFYSNTSEDTNFDLCCVSSSMTKEPPQEDFGPQYHRTARICILISMIAFSLLGNSMICWQLLPFRRKRFPKSKVLFLNLAAADLCVTFFAMSSQTIWEIMGKIWLAGDAFCRIVKFLQTYSLTLSTYILVAIALDRYNAIVKPFSRTPAPKSYAIAAWITSLLPSAPCYFVFHEVIVSPNVSYCVSIFYSSQYPHYWRQLYMAYIFLSIFIIPSLLLLGLYSRILVEIWTQSSVFSSNELSASSLPRAKTKTLKMTIAIFLTFMITNLPYVIQEMILAFGDSKLLDPNIVALFGVISASNSAFNPYIYLTFQSKPTCFGKCFRCIMAAIRSQSCHFPSSNQNRNTSFDSSKTSSRVDINTHSLYPHTHAIKMSSMNNISKKDETYL